MAINITQAPASNCSAHDPIIWKFQFTALGTPPVERRLRYYLADSSGNRLSETYVWTPKSTAEQLTVDVSDTVKALLSTVFPTCSVGIQADSGPVKGIKIIYGESNFNTSTCVDTTSFDNETSVVYAWNTALNVDTGSNFVWSGGKTGSIMNSYPSRMYWSTDSEPYMWFAGIGMAQITFYNLAGASLGTTNHNLTGATTAKYISLDWRCYSVASRPHSALLEVNEGLGYRNYIISYDVCSCRDFYTGITFLDPLGGRSHVSIECPSEISVQREGSEIYRYNPSITTKGRSFFNPVGSEQLKFKVVIGNTYEDQAFARALLGSPGHHLLRMANSGTKSWYKFILSGGTVTTIKQREKILIELSGFLADDKSGQNLDI